MRKPQKTAHTTNWGGLRTAGAKLACRLVVAGALCLSGCSGGGGSAGFDAQPGATPGTAVSGTTASDATAAPGATASQGLRHEVSAELTPATVDRVVDGDTLKLLIDGESVRVRLIGINTPESVAPEEGRNTDEGDDASAFVKSRLREGDDVWLMFDTEPYDRYDRMLAYVWTEVPEDFTDPDEVRTKMLNAFLADQGYAVVHAYRPNDAYCDMLHGFADDAQAAGRGLWETSDNWVEGI